MDIVEIDLNVNQYMKTADNGTVMEDLVLKEKLKLKWTLTSFHEGRERDRYFEMKLMV